MRLTLIPALLLSLLCCNPLWAADAADPQQWRISILASEISTSSSNQYGNDDAHGGIGLGIAYVPNPQWDVELTVSSQTHISPSAIFIRTGPLEGPGQQTYQSFEFRRYRVMPIDLTATRHFLTGQQISPYVRAGVRYVEAPEDRAPQFFVGVIDPAGVPYYPVVLPESGFNFSDRASAEVGAGARIRLTPRTAIRVEADRLLRSSSADFDPLTRYAVGLSWMF
jgi:hypothetical protein